MFIACSHSFLNNHYYDVNNNIKHLPNDDTLLSQLVGPLESYWGQPTCTVYCRANQRQQNSVAKCLRMESQLYSASVLNMSAVLILHCLPPVLLLPQGLSDWSNVLPLSLVFWKQWTQEPSIQSMCVPEPVTCSLVTRCTTLQCFINSNE